LFGDKERFFVAAFLTVDRMVTAIENVEDLVRRPEIKYGIVRGGATQTFFAVIIYFFVMSEFEIGCFFFKEIRCENISTYVGTYATK